jgi:hypothetical protein
MARCGSRVALLHQDKRVKHVRNAGKFIRNPG